jgi:hypothetical protein
MLRGVAVWELLKTFDAWPQNGVKQKAGTAHLVLRSEAGRVGRPLADF